VLAGGRVKAFSIGKISIRREESIKDLAFGCENPFLIRS